GCRFPVVLHEAVEHVLRNRVELLLRRTDVLDVTEEKIAEADAGVLSVEGESRPRAVGRVHRHRDALQVGADLQGVTPANPRKGVEHLKQPARFLSRKVRAARRCYRDGAGSGRAQSALAVYDERRKPLDAGLVEGSLDAELVEQSRPKEIDQGVRV